MTTVKLDPETEQRLRRLAERSGQSASAQLNEIMAVGLDDLEDVEAAERVLAQIESGGEQLHSAKSLRVELGLDG
jgi:predicted DNA-binding protein